MPLFEQRSVFVSPLKIDETEAPLVPAVLYGGGDGSLKRRMMNYTQNSFAPLETESQVQFQKTRKIVSILWRIGGKNH